MWILFSGDKQIEVRRLVEVKMGRCILKDIKIDGDDLKLINMYGPPLVAGRKELLREMRQYLHISMPVILARDCNCVTGQGIGLASVMNIRVSF